MADMMGPDFQPPSELVRVLDRHESFVAYHRTYGDSPARSYEDNVVIVVPHIPITFDLALFAAMTWPAKFKKIGSFNGLGRPFLKRNGGQIETDAANPITRLAGGDTLMAAYLQSQIALFNSELRIGLQHLFPRYRLPDDPSITWRMTPTANEPPHLDVFAQGKAMTEAGRHMIRLKAFINLDTQPRHWRISLALDQVLHAIAAKLPKQLPPDVNVVNDVINRLGVLADLPWYDLKFPQMSAVIANGETVAHQVLFGRRMVCYEAGCWVGDMLAPDNVSHARIGSWLESAGIELDRRPNPRAEDYTTVPSPYV